MRLGTGRAQFRHKEERGMAAAPIKLLIYLVPEGGLEPPQGCPYRILNSLFHFSGSVYRSTSHRNIRVSVSLLPGCARCALMVWAQYGHSKAFLPLPLKRIGSVMCDEI